MPDDNCKEIANSISQHIPFLSLVTGKLTMQTPLTTRLAEACIMGLVVAVCSYLLIIPRLEEKLVHLQNSVQEVKGDVKQIQRDLYQPKTQRDIHNSSDKVKI